MHSSRSLLAPLVLAIALLTPSASSAQFVQMTVGSFGHHVDSTTSDLVTHPIGRAECDALIPIDFTGLMLSTEPRYIDVWRSQSAGAWCQQPQVRADGLCGWMSGTLGASPRVAEDVSSLAVTPREIIGDCTSGRATLWFLDTSSSPDVASIVTAGTYTTLDIVLDADAPNAPIIDAPTDGDTALPLQWTNPSDLGAGGIVRVYFDPNGCPGLDAGVEAYSAMLVAGAPPPSSEHVYLDVDPTYGVAQIPAALFDWSPARYGETGALAITAVDAADNESVLSNVICVTHVPIARADASTPPDGGMGDGRYLIRACSVGGRPQPLALAPIMLALVVLSSRRVGGLRERRVS